MERMERQQAAASSASSQQLQVFIGQGELIYLILLKFLKIYSFCIMILSMEFVECYTLCSTLWKEVGRPLACLPACLSACSELRLGLRPEARVSGAKMCDSKHCLVLT
jgi:hypothetical protein